MRKLPTSVRTALGAGILLLVCLAHGTSANAAGTPVEARGQTVQSAHFYLGYRLPGWDQVYRSESAEEQEEEGEEQTEANTGAYSAIDKLSGSGRCVLEIESNAIFSPSAPHISDGIVSGAGTHLLQLSRRWLSFASSGSDGANRWFLGSVHGDDILALSLQPAPAALAGAGEPYLIAEFALHREAYLAPKDFYISPPPSAAQRAACLSLQQLAVRRALIPILDEAHGIPGRYRPGKKRSGHELPRCAAEACPALRVTSTVQIFQTVPLWDTKGRSAHQTFVRWRATGRITPIGAQTPPAPLLRAVGRYVAYPQTSFNKYNDVNTSWSIVRVDASTGQYLEAAALTEDDVLPQGQGGVSDLTLAPDGGLAWIVEGTERNPRVNSVLRLQPGATAPEQLASGETVQPRTLTYEAGTIRWREGSSSREAPLP